MWATWWYSGAAPRGLADIPYDVTFAFVFHAFQPEGIWHLE